MAERRRLIITIDGLVGAGKSSTACAVARALGYRHIDTGAMYRTVALAGRCRDVPAVEGPVLSEMLSGLFIELESQDQGGRVLLDGEDVSIAIRQPEISRRVGAYADLPMVRRMLIESQQAMGVHGGAVADGRDVGTVVFPQADLKVLMVASLEERAFRRHHELNEKGVDISRAEVAADIEERDQQDLVRDYGANHDPDEMMRLDTTVLTFSTQVNTIVGCARQRGA